MMTSKKNGWNKIGALAFAGILTASQFGTAFAATADGALNTTNDADGSNASPEVTEIAENTSRSGEYIPTDVVIDTNRRGDIAIHKYDITTANENGVDVSAIKSDGEPNADAEAKLEKYAMQGAVFSYVKLGGVETMSTSPMGENKIQLIYKIPSTLANLIGLNDADWYTSAQLNLALRNFLTSDVHAKTKLERWMADNEAVKMPETDGNGVATSTNMDLGLYLFVETNVPQTTSVTTEPFFLSVPMTDVTGSYWIYSPNVYPKNQTSRPTLDKLVKDPDTGFYQDSVSACEGSTLDYLIVNKLPEITSESTFLTQYEIVDALSAGQKYKRDNVSIAFYENEDDAKKNNRDKASQIWEGKEGGSAKFTAVFDEAAEVQEMTIVPTAEGLEEINRNYSNYYMVISYQADLDSDAKVVLGDKGNLNDATLTYSRTNFNYREQARDKTLVFTYGIDIKKTFSDGGGDARKVKFTLRNAQTKQWIKAKEKNGVYYVSDEVDIENEATVFAPDRGGDLHIYGLDADSYTLTETKTDKGYAKLAEPIDVRFDATDAKFTVNESSANVDDPEYLVPTLVRSAAGTVGNTKVKMEKANDSENAIIQIKVENKKGKPEKEPKTPDKEKEKEPKEKEDKPGKSKGGGGGGGGSSRKTHLPNTGGAGKIAASVIGIGAVICGAFAIKKSKTSDTEVEDSDSNNS